MGHADYYRHGSHNVICDVCGRKFKRHEVLYRWDGVLVCRADWEPRQPQDFVSGVADSQNVQDVRTENADYFVSTNEITPEDL